MSANDLILLVLIAGGAFYAGYQVGRLKALAEAGAARRLPPEDDDQPLPGPRLDRSSPEPASRPKSAPPASAGDEATWQEAGAASGRAPPRRSTKPPPAAAGLMGSGEAEKSGRRQK